MDFEQIVKSIMAYLVSKEPGNTYIQKIVKDVKYPCYILSNHDISTSAINACYFNSVVSLYIQLFDTNEVALKKRAHKLVSNLFQEKRMIPLLNKDGSHNGKYLRFESIDCNEIVVDQIDVYCMEMNFSFETTLPVNVIDYQLMMNIEATYEN